LKLAIIALVIFLTAWCLRFAFNRPTFNPEKIAHMETQMWQSYYFGDKMELGLQLIALLRSQYGLSLMEAKGIGELLASSAMKFHAARGDYDNVALPDLIKAYGLLKQAIGAAFDSEKVAKAELAWWVARRTPGQNSKEQVGEKITELYVIFYGYGSNAFVNAGQLRAQAAAIRDAGKENADWKLIEEKLFQSYTELENEKLKK
jgi:hypothetical protein